MTPQSKSNIAPLKSAVCLAAGRMPASTVSLSSSSGSGCRKPDAGFLAAGLRLGGRFVLLIPDFRLLFDGGSVGTRHVGNQHGSERLAAWIAPGARQNRPEIGLIQAWRDTATAPVERSQLRLSRHVIVFGGLAEPASRLSLIGLHSVFLI